MVGSVLANAVVNITANAAGFKTQLAGVRAQLIGFNATAAASAGKFGSYIIAPLVTLATVAATVGTPLGKTGKIISQVVGGVVSLGQKLASMVGISVSAASAITIVGVAAAVATGAVIALTAAVAVLAKIGDELNIAFANVAQTFGKSSQAIIEAADAMAIKWGTSREEFLRYADALGQQFQKIGISESKAAKMAIDLTEGARARAKARGTSFESEFGEIQKTIGGGGNLINQQQVSAKAVEMGGRPGAPLTKQTEEIARYHLVMEVLNRDIKIAETGSSTLTDELAKLWDHMKNIGGMIGTVLVPPITWLVQVLNFLAIGFERLGVFLAELVDWILYIPRAIGKLIPGIGKKEDLDAISKRNEEQRAKIEGRSATGQYLGGGGGSGGGGYQGGLKGFADRIQQAMFSDRTPALLKKQNDISAESVKELKKIVAVVTGPEKKDEPKGWW